MGWGAHAQARGAAALFEETLIDAAAAVPALAQQLIERWEAELADEQNSRPEVEAIARIALGRVYLLVGDRVQAKSHLERAEQLAGTTVGLGPSVSRRASRLLREAEAE
ncbi:MAG: hypothetical protein ACI8QC_001055 [Planctomycetota bacterium]|jgi:hypothetical protein